ncbi:MAG: hypothetical protein WBZ37_06000 [Mycobacterium sp.]
MNKLPMALGALMCAPVLLAAPAHANTESDYLGRVQEELPTVYARYGSAAILDEGYRICSYEAAGLDGAGEVDRVKADMPMSEGSAVALASIASVWLGC